MNDATNLVVLDPTAGRGAEQIPAAARIEEVAGKTIGLLDISKPRGNVFLDRLAEMLTERGATVARYSKPTFAKPAPVDLRHEIADRCDAVIEALAD
jgi:hypothetical protein